VSKKRAIVLLSGGLDSTTVLAIARHADFDVYALSFDYGQRHASEELNSASLVAWEYAVADHIIMDIDQRAFSTRLNKSIPVFEGSALTDDIDVPKNCVTDGIPVTYVPARNTIFLSFALMWAEVLESTDIFIGVNALDYSGYPDCRPEYIKTYEKMANLATRAGVEGRQKLKIHTPLIDLTKAQIVQKGNELGVDYGITCSCYDPGSDGKPCGQCDSCRLRAKGFAEAGCDDPLIARKGIMK